MRGKSIFSLMAAMLASTMRNPLAPSQDRPRKPSARKSKGRNKQYCWSKYSAHYGENAAARNVQHRLAGTHGL
jgi:hypothetical protein